jgi:hypothetical protein
MFRFFGGAAIGYRPGVGAEMVFAGRGLERSQLGRGWSPSLKRIRWHAQPSLATLGRRALSGRR